MNKYKFCAAIVLLLIAMSLPVYAHAQSKKDSVTTVAVKALVTSGHYTFKAQTMTPLSGRLRQLTSDYDVQVSPDKIISQLPYFGRAYAVTSYTADAGISFTAKDFTYTVGNNKKDGWNVTIQYKDAGDVQQMQFTIFSNGQASLQVTSNNRQSISYNGYITNVDKKK